MVNVASAAPLFVSVPVVSPPLSLKPTTVWSLPFKSRVAPVPPSASEPEPLGSAFATPRMSVPALTVVPPEWLPAPFSVSVPPPFFTTLPPLVLEVIPLATEMDPPLLNARLWLLMSTAVPLSTTAPPALFWITSGLSRKMGPLNVSVPAVF